MRLRSSLGPLGVPLALTVAVSLSGCYLLRGLRYFGPDVRDGERFPRRALPAAAEPDVLAEARPLRLAGYRTSDGDSLSVEDYFRATNTAGLLIVRGDSVVYQWYGDGYAADQPVLAFSVTKSWIGTLVGISVGEGLLSVDDPVRRWLPELDADDWDGVTVEHLLQMTTGNAFREDQHPLHESARFYLGKGLRKKALRQNTDHAPGERFEYRSGDTQLLTQILQAAVAPRTVTEYLRERLWEPIGAQHAGWMNVDGRGEGAVEKGFCCLNATAVDQARLGMLMRDGGRWRGRQVVPADWVARTLAVDSSAGSAPYYQYHWWLGDPGRGDFLAEGIINQFVYVDPASDIVIVKQSYGYGVWNKWNLMRGLVRRVREAMGEV